MKQSELKKASSIFDGWRQQSAGGRSGYPVELQKLATTLSTRYGVAKTADTLGISEVSLYQWLKAHKQKKRNKMPSSVPAKFVEVTKPTVPVADTIEIALPNAIFLRVRPGISTDFVGEICRKLMPVIR